MDPECMACRTASGAFAADEVYRDDRVVAVLSQHAVNPGHLVVVTLEHVRNALTIEADLLAHMMLVGRELGARMMEALPCPSIMLVFNNEAPCQTLFHAHLHVVPRHFGDEMDHKFGSAVAAPERAALAARLRPAFVSSRVLGQDGLSGGVSEGARSCRTHTAPQVFCGDGDAGRGRPSSTGIPVTTENPAQHPATNEAARHLRGDAPAAEDPPVGRIGETYR